MAIYTAPVKSLANQKYVDLCKMFDNVGLITGDVSNNPTGDVIVMTAEVLRNHLMSKSSLITRCKHIVLDEAHYLGDTQRGVVWEQIIIAASSQIRFVLLTATLPNGGELAQWLTECTNIPTHIVTQRRRPVPLRINALSDTQGIEIIKDGENPAYLPTIAKYCKSEGILGSSATSFALPKEPPPFTVATIANSIATKGYVPLILFCLSRKRCIMIANELEGIPGGGPVGIFDAEAESWSAEIRASEQFAMVRGLIEKGIGIHHSGIMPILRETVELLFSSGQLSILVATETFALGVNAPARAVMFSSLVKWGGSAFRPISTAEFLQMAGRAGRRGFDRHGDVFIIVQEGTAPQFIESVIETKPERLESRMRVSPWLILSCHSSGSDPKEFIAKSLLRFQERIRLAQLKEETAALPPMTPQEKVAADFARAIGEIVHICLVPQNIRKVLEPGRLIYIVFNGVRWGWASVINVDGKGRNVEVITSAVLNEARQFVPCSDVKKAQLIDVTFPINDIRLVSSTVVKNPQTVFGMERASTFLDVLNRIKSKYHEIPLIEKMDILKVGRQKAEVLVQRSKELLKGFSNKQKTEILETAIATERRFQMEAEISSLENPPYEALSDRMTAVLTELGYMDNEGLLSLKGRVSECLRVEDPIPIVELLFDGYYTQMTSENICAVVSCFVESPPKFKCPMNPSTVELWSQLKTAHQKIKKLELFMRPHKKLMGFAASFVSSRSIAAAVDSSPGLSVGMAVRIIKRIRELLAMLADASKVMGADALSQRFVAAQELLASGVNFDASLYK